MPSSEQYLMPNYRQTVSLSHVCPLSPVSVSLSLQSLRLSFIPLLSLLPTCLSLSLSSHFLSFSPASLLSVSCLSLSRKSIAYFPISLYLPCVSLSHFTPHKCSLSPLKVSRLLIFQECSLAYKPKN